MLFVKSLVIMMTVMIFSLTFREVEIQWLSNSNIFFFNENSQKDIKEI